MTYSLTHIPEAYRANVAALAEVLIAFETREDGQKVDNWKIDNPMCLKQAGFTWEANRSVQKNNRVVIAVKIFTQGHGKFSFDIRH